MSKAPHDVAGDPRHGLPLEEVARRIARELCYELSIWDDMVKEGQRNASKRPTKYDETRHRALIHGMELSLSIALYGDPVHLWESEQWALNQFSKEQLRR